jgi:hypothetical protein
MDDLKLILPAALRFGAICWALAWWGVIRRTA